MTFFIHKVTFITLQSTNNDLVVLLYFCTTINACDLRRGEPLPRYVYSKTTERGQKVILP